MGNGKPVENDHGRDNRGKTFEGRYFSAGQPPGNDSMGDTASLRERLEEAGPFDIVVGIHTRNVETTILHVMNVVAEGLQQHYPDRKCLLVVSDGFSKDDTIHLAEFYPAPRGVRKVVATQLGGRGKGNGVRTTLEIARIVGARACALVDGDLVSVRPIWVDQLLRPILHGIADVVVPYYQRDKWDGVITNHLCYPFSAALYGRSVRQPIGGEYGLSREFLEHVLDQEDFPETFGIDIFLTTTAIAEGYRIQEAPLGIKTHASTRGYSDPREVLSGMYYEVVDALIHLAGKYEEHWRAPGIEAPVILSESVFSYYDRLPPAASVSEDSIREIFTQDVGQHMAVLQAVLEPELIETIENAAANHGFNEEEWARLTYAILAQAIAWNDEDRRKPLVDALCTLGMGRFLHFVRETKDASLEEAFDLIQEQARTFQRLRREFIARMDVLAAHRADRPLRRASSTPSP